MNWFWDEHLYNKNKTHATQCKNETGEKKKRTKATRISANESNYNKCTKWQEQIEIAYETRQKKVAIAHKHCLQCPDIVRWQTVIASNPHGCAFLILLRQTKSGLSRLEKLYVDPLKLKMINNNTFHQLSHSFYLSFSLSFSLSHSNYFFGVFSRWGASVFTNFIRIYFQAVELPVVILCKLQTMCIEWKCHVPWIHFMCYIVVRCNKHCALKALQYAKHNT